jgi:hypothetical protein
MYNTKIICTYNSPDVFLESDEISDVEKKFVRDVIYRQELLDIFSLKEYDETEISTCIHELYERIKLCQELKECIMKISGRFMIVDDEIGLMLLFSFDYMHISHICISEYLESGNISEQNILKLTAILV